jgi:hypothetical protein
MKSLIIASFFAAQLAQAIPAFPGAEGAGAEATGGRHGTVFVVNTLASDGPGSLADAVSQPNRYIVFAVAGIIDITTTKDGKPKGGRLEIKQPNLTIAGQTAPGEGICIKGGSLTVAASNVILQHLRVRRGFVHDGDAGDAVEINVKDPNYVKPKFKGTDKDQVKERLAVGETLQPASKVIFDHISSSWATDENFTMSGHIDRVHAQYCFAAEALDYDNPKQTPPNHAYGSLMGGSSADGRVGMHHSIFAHHRRRTPQCSTGDGAGSPPVVIDFRNNIVYNSIAAMSHTGGNPVRLNFVNNYYKVGPSSEEKLAGHWFTMLKGNDQSKLHASGNYIFNGPEATADNWKGVLFEGKVKFTPSMVIATEYDVPKVTTQSAEIAYSIDLDSSGATLPARDAVDTRVAKEIATGTGKVIQKQPAWPDYRALPILADSDHDGLPDAWEKARGLTDPMAITDGYANIEHYANSINSVYVSAHIARANAGQPGEWRIHRHGDLTKPQDVTFTITGDAVSDRDYAALPTQLTIPAGISYATLPIQPLPSLEDDKTAVLTLSGSNIGCPTRALIVLRK